METVVVLLAVRQAAHVLLPLQDGGLDVQECVVLKLFVTLGGNQLIYIDAQPAPVGVVQRLQQFRHVVLVGPEPRDHLLVGHCGTPSCAMVGAPEL